MDVKYGYNAYCLDCGRKANDDDLSCSKCGCNTLFLGEEGVHYTRGENGLECVCGAQKLHMNIHLNMDEIHKSVYECLVCGRKITLDTKVEEYC